MLQQSSHKDRLAREHGGIKWNDPENENGLVMPHSTKIHWKRERKRKDRINHTGHYTLATNDGNGMVMSVPEE